MKPFRLCAAALFLLSASHAAYAADYTWDAGAGTTDWLTAQNWSADLLPTVADNALINMASGVTIAGPGAAASLVRLGTSSGGTGNLTITTGGVLTGTVLAGSATGGTGTLTVNGGQLDSAGSEIRIGNVGNGTMRIQNGGIVQTGGIGYVAFGATSNSSVIVEDANSQWNVTGSTRVGQGGTGSLTVRNGGALNSTDYVVFGSSAGSNGTGTITGANSLLSTNASFYVGDSGTGTLNVLNGAAATSATTLYVGTSAAGTLNIQSGGTVTSNTSAVFGNGAAAMGTLVIDGAGSKLTTLGALYVGNAGTGNLTIQNGGASSSTEGYLARNAGSTSTVTVTGSGSNTQYSGILYVGYLGAATLNVQNGGMTSSANSIRLGNSAGSSGTSTVNGANSLLTTPGFMYVGSAGTGALTIQNGGKANAATGIYVGSAATGSGTVTIDGVGSELMTSSILYIGLSGAGTMNVQNGGKASNTTDGYIGRYAGSTGSVTVDGAGSQWVNGASLRIGQEGTGNLTVQNGGMVSSSASTIRLGDSVGSSGTATVNGTGSSLAASSTLYVGTAGTGTLNIQNGGTANSSASVIIANTAGSIGAAAVDGVGSNLHSTGIFYIGYGGTGNLTVRNGGAASGDSTVRVGDQATGVGTLTVESGGTFSSVSYAAIGYDAGSNGTVTVTGANSLMSTDTAFYIGNAGTGMFNVQNGGTARSVGSTFIGDDAGSTGTATVDGVNSLLEAALFYVGNLGTGTLAVRNSGVANSASGLYVGNTGTGILTVESGGKAHSATSVLIGDDIGSTGTATVNGANSLLDTNTILYVGAAGKGTLNIQNGGTAKSVSHAIIGNSAGSIGTVTVDGVNSLLNTDTILYVGNLGTGSLTVRNSGKTSAADTLRVGNSAASVGTLTVESGGTATSVSDAVIGNVAGSTGTATVTGVNSLLNTDNVLYVGNGGAGTLNVENGGRVRSADNAAFGNAAGSSGTVTVTGANSLVEIGKVLSVGLSGTGILNVENGGRAASVGNTTIGNVAGSTGTATVTGVSSVLQSSGSLIVGNGGAGTLTLTSGGAAQAPEISVASQAGSTGTLNIGAASLDPAAAAGVLDAQSITFGAGTGTIVFNHTDANYVVSANISGNGTLNFLAGTTKLTGDNTGFTGRMLGNSAVEVTSGITDIDSNSAAFAGTTDVAGGILRVNGSLGGTTTISGTGRLQGNATLNDLIVDNGGTAAPGNSIGTVNVVNTTFNPGSVYEVEVNAAGQSDLINATGTATLNGGTVLALAFPDYRLNQPYTILTAAGGVAGVFDNATDNFLFFNSSLTYDANNVYLTLVQAGPSTESVARTRNQKAVGSAIDGGGVNNAAVVALLASQAQEDVWRGLDALSGEIHASMGGALIRGQDVLQNPGGSADETRVYGSGRMWIKSFGRFGHVEDVLGAAAIDQNDVGVLTGLETDLNDKASIGFGLGASRTNVRANARDSKADSKNYHALFYADKDIGGGLTLNGGASYTFHQIETERHIAISPFSGQSNADYNAHTGQVYAGISKQYQIRENTMFEPYIQGEYLYQISDRFHESGEAGLKGKSDGYGIGFADIGVKARHDVMTEMAPLGLGAEVGYRHAIGHINPSRDMSFNSGGGNFTVEGAPLDLDAVILGTSITADLANDLDFTIGYEGAFAPDSLTHHVSGRLNFMF